MLEVFFWTSMTASILLSLLGIYYKKPYFLLISAVLIVPLSLYLAATPRFSLWGLIFPLFYIGGFIALKKNKARLSLLIITPVFLIVGWIGYLALMS